MPSKLSAILLLLLLLLPALALAALQREPAKTDTQASHAAPAQHAHNFLDLVKTRVGQLSSSLSDLPHSLKVHVAKHKADASKQQRAKTRSMSGDPCEQWSNPLMMEMSSSMTNCSTLDFFDASSRASGCECMSGMLDMVGSLSEADLSSLMACPMINISITTWNMTCRDNQFAACLDQLSNVESPQAAMGVICSDCVQMMYQMATTMMMMISGEGEMSMPASSNEDQVMNNVMELCDQCTPAAVLEAMTGSSSDYKARASLLCSSCGMKVMQAVALVEPDSRMSMIASAGCYQDQGSYCAERYMNEAEFAPKWSTVLSACGLPAEPMSVTDYTYMSYMGLACSMECQEALASYQSYMGCCLNGLGDAMPWQFQTIWQNITDTCYANNMQDSNSTMTPPPSCDMYSTYPMHKSIKLAIENLYPDYFMYGMYGMYGMLSYGGNDFLNSAVMDFVTSFPATYNGTYLHFSTYQYPLATLQLHVKVLSAEHDAMLTAELSPYVDNKFSILQASRRGAGAVLGLMRGWTEMYSDMKVISTAPMPLYMLNDYWNPGCYAGSSWKNISRDPLKTFITGGLGKQMLKDKKEVWMCLQGQGTCGWFNDAYCYVYDESWSAFIPWDYQTKLGIVG
ncbi:hypothetical protein GUITHDRAFT_148161 [Guillardia theta CCMP2712]|uniref:Uncharacterized protein n=1 Tax=Guillardia theta (strain CCMP2712) TaxID=905079 RepID=L1IB76_GUITC|nr:hypothetical protein GUITHDRAFT_148161 [Guillardia theta CCMP2712]EKX33100.1 hypothetical protein GUITHDRAFT_148161 [Guillardia theta CCMP2712]|eukprot:XP_005820080.1 hypothetical protein GUITHDRAFT_148161 [Guillardia theta CCMP2712]